jgi:hypothetical protein
MIEICLFGIFCLLGVTGRCVCKMGYVLRDRL